MLTRYDVTGRHTPHPTWAHPAERGTARIAKLLLTAVLLCMSPTFAEATTTVPLNTGYNHGSFVPYPAFTGTGSSNIADNYWINIASYPTTTPPIGVSWVLPPGGWAPPFPNSHWISAWKVRPGPATSGALFQYPAYTIFRKCFCLSPNFKNASLTFRMRGDDNFQAWFNSILNVALPATPSNHWPAAPIAGSLPSAPQWFKVGRNCLFVLLEDAGGAMGFDLVGSITADGLAEQPAVGPNQTFGCPCPDSIGHPQGSAADEQQTIREIVAVAEERLANRLAMQAAASRNGASSLLRATPWLQTSLLTSGGSRRPRT